MLISLFNIFLINKNNFKKKKVKVKQLSILGTYWDFSSILNSQNLIFKINYISFYEPLLKNKTNKQKVLLFNEKSKNHLLWLFKIVRRNYKIIKIITKFKPEIIVTHHDDANLSILPTLFLYKYILKNKIKFIGYIHNGNLSIQDNIYLKFFILFSAKYFYKYFDKIITVSYGNKIYLEKKFKLKNIEVIYNPIDLNKYLKLGKKNLEKKNFFLFENNSFKFITIGRFTLQKNLFNLLEVFSKLKKYNIKLYIIGDGELKKKLGKKIEELNLEGKVYLIGFQNNVFNFIKNSDCFILNSYWESFGQVLTESLIFNKIIISTDCKSGPREILCPELKLNKKIRYPYFGKFGILTKPYSLNSKNLNSNLVLENLLSEIIKNKDKYIKKYNHGIIRAKDFDETNISKIIREKLK